MHFLNKKFLKKNYPTNILAFPYDIKLNKKILFLGDLVVCNKIVQEEAHQQKKILDAHWAHIIIHGTLHLLGYDHVNSLNNKKIMQFLEIKVLRILGYNNPYEK